MKIIVCIGSSCHLKGSRQVVEDLQRLITEHQLSDQIEMTGAFCMGNCQKGVSVQWQGKTYSLNQDNVDEFFKTQVISQL